MNKTDLVEAKAQKTVFTKKDSEAALNAILAVIPRNPEKTIKIEEYYAPVFKARKGLKEAVDKGGKRI